jgi:hypothetical protein
MDAREHSPHAGDDPAEGTLDELETEVVDELAIEVVEDLDVEDEADGVEGGTLVGTMGCPTVGCVAN